MSDPRQAATLGATGLFAALTPTARERLAQASSILDVPHGHRLFARGDTGEAAYLVVTGELEVAYQAIDGREVWLSRCGPGSVIGELALLDGLPRSADVSASRRSRLLRIPRTAFLDVLRSDPEAALGLLALIASRLRQTDEMVEASRLLDLRARLARHLLEAGAVKIAATQGEIARIIGASREKVNRHLSAWRRDGIIEVSRAGIVILDRLRLKAAANPTKDEPA